jgi:hypothetical protein
MALRALGWGYAAFPHPLPSGVASYVARNCCKRLRLATASTSENFSPRGAHEKACALLAMVVDMTTMLLVIMTATRSLERGLFAYPVSRISIQYHKMV